MYAFESSTPHGLDINHINFQELDALSLVVCASADAVVADCEERLGGPEIRRVASTRTHTHTHTLGASKMHTQSTYILQHMFC